MKAVSKGFLPEIFTNPINRNLALILVGGLVVAVTLVTAAVILLNQL